MQLLGDEAVSTEGSVGTRVVPAAMQGVSAEVLPAQQQLRC